MGGAASLLVRGVEFALSEFDCDSDAPDVFPSARTEARRDDAEDSFGFVSDDSRADRAAGFCRSSLVADVLRDFELDVAPPLLDGEDTRLGAVGGSKEMLALR